MMGMQMPDNGLKLKNMGVQLQTFGNQIQNIGLEISKSMQNIGYQIQNIGAQLCKFSLQIFNIGFQLSNNNYNNFNNNNYNNFNNNMQMDNTELLNKMMFLFQQTTNNNINNVNANENYNELEGPIMTITFIDKQKGTKINIRANSNLKVEELLKLYFKRIGMNPSFNNSNIYFLFNGQKLNIDDKTKIDKLLDNRISSFIYVIHSGELLGGP